MLPLSCLDIGSGCTESLLQLARMIGDAPLRHSGGHVRGLHLSGTVEPEAMIVSSTCHVPRLVTAHSPAVLALDFNMLTASLQDHTHEAVEALDMSRLGNAYMLLEQLCQQYVFVAVQNLQGKTIPKWHHQLLHAWCAIQQPPQEPFVSPSDVLSAHPDLWPELALAEKCAPHLAEVLQGTTGYQGLLFSGGSMDTVRPVYQDAVVASFYNECVVEAVRAVMTHRPAGRQL